MSAGWGAQAALAAAVDPLLHHGPTYVAGHGVQSVATLLPRLELAKRLLQEVCASSVPPSLPWHIPPPPHDPFGCRRITS